MRLKLKLIAKIRRRLKDSNISSLPQVSTSLSYCTRTYSLSHLPPFPFAEFSILFDSPFSSFHTKTTQIKNAINKTRFSKYTFAQREREGFISVVAVGNWMQTKRWTLLWFIVCVCAREARERERERMAGVSTCFFSFYITGTGIEWGEVRSKSSY